MVKTFRIAKTGSKIAFIFRGLISIQREIRCIFSIFAPSYINWGRKQLKGFTVKRSFVRQFKHSWWRFWIFIKMDYEKSFGPDVAVMINLGENNERVFSFCKK